MQILDYLLMNFNDGRKKTLEIIRMFVKNLKSIDKYSQNMNRRDFLKTSATIAGAAALAPTVSEAAPKNGKTTTPLQVEGYVKEPSRRTPVVDRADVVIIGGGPAGFAAAVSAARQGVDVLMLEREYFLGGLFTGCGVTPIINSWSPSEKGNRVQAVAGICDELCGRLDKAGMLCIERIHPKADPEAAKYFMEEMVAESGARMLYGVTATQVIMSGDTISSVILEGKSGRVAVNAKFVIDCSGDGDVLEWSGEDFTVYRNDIGAMWRIGNAKNCTKGNATPVPGVRTIHAVGEKGQDGLDMYNLTRIQTLLRKRMWEDTQQLRTNPGCKDLFLLDTPSVVGVRVTRVLNSVLNVSARGAVSGQCYDDVIGYAGAGINMTVDGKKYEKNKRPIWQVPYSSITPKTVSNLLVAGRCFGFDEQLTYDAREIGTCLMTGQAAGTAAAQAILGRCSCRDVDIKQLQSTLKKNGVIL